MMKNTITTAASVAGESSVNVTSLKALLTHLICGLGLGSAFYAAHSVYAINLTENPEQTIRLLWVIEAPVVILLYSLFQHSSNQCSYLKAVFRGLLGLPTGAIVNALGAIALGAPMIQNFERTIHWSLLMSVLTCVPAASVLGSSWADWQRIFALTKASKPLEYMICIPAHGAVIGAWFGAWPMPLDWERPWQEWPICVTYGAVAGYFVGMVASIGFVVFNNHSVRVKGD
ncbi:OLC1v1014527C1 [Oldenlandia corymbosa var. corymbosa]|uniref:OLC1v1014527C1 n=1 Tax=Oldenlandia corymbosa var. corymbosa TaxID=529605 RepID=A0AAV1E3F7_OLDCO|nr:OLC1v1014527C1 [Oldenlandia corymbosa var. corymbosa]